MEKEMGTLKRARQMVEVQQEFAKHYGNGVIAVNHDSVQVHLWFLMTLPGDLYEEWWGKADSEWPWKQEKLFEGVRFFSISNHSVKADAGLQLKVHEGSVSSQ